MAICPGRAPGRSRRVNAREGTTAHSGVPEDRSCLGVLVKGGRPDVIFNEPPDVVDQGHEFRRPLDG